MIGTLGGKLGVVTGGYLLILLLVSGYVVLNVIHLRADTDHLRNGTLAYTQQNGVYRNAFTRALGEAKVFALSGVAEEYEQAEEALEQAKAALAKLDRDHSFHEQLNQEQLQTASSLYAERRSMLDQLQDLIVTLENADDSMREQVVDELEAREAEFSELEARVDLLVDADQAIVTTVVGRQLNSSLVSVIVLFAFCMIFSVGMLIAIHRMVTQPVQQLSLAIERVASGDRTITAPITSNDEIGVLQRNFNAMAATLGEQTHALAQQIQSSEAARDAAEAARAEVSSQLATIETQQNVIREMSVPVIPVSRETLVLPLVGALDTTRLNHLQTQSLQAIEHSSARTLVLDVTGVPIVDTQVAQGLLSTVRACRLLGANTVLVGIRPEVAQAMVSVGINLHEVRTFSDLQSALGPMT